VLAEAEGVSEPLALAVASAAALNLIPEKSDMLTRWQEIDSGGVTHEAEVNRGSS
jgi:hypothetical protein